MRKLPRFEQTRLAREHAEAASGGRLTLQRCQDCGALQYPYREVCGECLGDTLVWQIVDGHGTVGAAARVHASMHAFFRDNAPWSICSVRLDAGPRVIAHAGEEQIRSGSRVTVTDELIEPEYGVLVARHEKTAKRK